MTSMGETKRHTVIRAILFLAAAGVHAQETRVSHAVCMEIRVRVDSALVLRARALAGAVLLQAGVRIEWLSSKECRIPGENVVRLVLDSAAPPRFGPETMAYALPYDVSETAIHIFYPRVVEDHWDAPAQVLGHVIAHELGHVLEGVARHSNEGLMKARWGPRDYALMWRQRLFLAAEDVELIHLGLKRFSTPITTARAGRE